MTDKAYLLQTLREDFPLTCGRACQRHYLWTPPHRYMMHLAMLYTGADLLPRKIKNRTGLFAAEVQEIVGTLLREETEAFRKEAYDGRFPGLEEEFLADCASEPLTEERIAALLLKYRDRSPGLEEDDAAYVKDGCLEKVTAQFLREVRIAVRSMEIRYEPPETDIEKAKRLAREKREQELWEERERERVAALPVSELHERDVSRIDDIDRLCLILRECEDDRVVEAALRKIRYVRLEDDLDIVRECLPGKCTWSLLSFLCEEEHETPYRYLTMNRLVRWVVPALQREGNYAAVELLDSLYSRKFGHYVNRERGSDLDYWQALEQFDASRTPEEAFRNISPYWYDRWNEVDDSDEFSYISSLDNEPFRIGGYSLHSWRMKCLREADLITEND